MKLKTDPLATTAAPARLFAPLAIIIATWMAIYVWVAAWDDVALSFQDSVEYLRIADYYRGVIWGAPSEESIAFYRTTRLPPAFPVVLALFGAGTDSQHAAAWAMALTSLLAVLAIWRWQSLERTGPTSAVLLALAVLLYPEFFLLNLYPVSEPLAMLLLAVLLVLVGRNDISDTRLLAAAAVVGLMPLVRGAMLPMLVAFPLWLWLRRDRPRLSLLLPCLVAWLPYAAWSLYRSLIGAESYVAQLKEERMAVLGGWPEVLWLQPGRLFDAWIRNWALDADATITAIALLIAVAATCGFLWRLRRNRLDAWFLGGYVALLLVWPYPTEYGRFLVVVYPLVLVCGLDGLNALLARLPAMQRSARIVAGVILCTSVITLSAQTASRFLHRAALAVDPSLLGEKREPPFFKVASDEAALMIVDILGRSRHLIAALAGKIGSDDCVYTVLPDMTHAIGRVKTRRYPTDLDHASSRQAATLLNECDWYLLINVETREPRFAGLYPWQTLEDWTQPVLVSETRGSGQTIPAALLLRRVTPTPE
jgi:hypothetical protein